MMKLAACGAGASGALAAWIENILRPLMTPSRACFLPTRGALMPA
jgi:hypothetical protein